MKRITRKLRPAIWLGIPVLTVKWRGRYYDYDDVTAARYDQPGPSGELAYDCGTGVSLVRLRDSPDTSGRVRLGEWKWK